MTAGRRPIAVLGWTLVVSAFGAQSASAQSEVFRCIDDQGHAVFSDTSCGSAAEKVEIVESSGGLSPIVGDGLSDQERGQLGASERRAAQGAGQRAPAGSPRQGGSTTPPAPSKARQSHY